mmetsp:Transcript_10350/g.21554  ORF Transcript_10350/g.21554 Transcript_10350/m.21554 type:complete len:212 (-) Transcript_10350:1468-2103(-)
MRPVTDATRMMIASITISGRTKDIPREYGERRPKTNTKRTNRHGRPSWMWMRSPRKTESAGSTRALLFYRDPEIRPTEKLSREHSSSCPAEDPMPCTSRNLICPPKSLSARKTAPFTSARQSPASPTRDVICFWWDRILEKDPSQIRDTLESSRNGRAEPRSRRLPSFLKEKRPMSRSMDTLRTNATGEEASGKSIRAASPFTRASTGLPN